MTCFDRVGPVGTDSWSGCTGMIGDKSHLNKCLEYTSREGSHGYNYYMITRHTKYNIYICYPPPRDLPFQNVLVPPQGDMTTRFSLRWSAYLHNYSPPRTCTLNLVGLTCIEVTSLVAERFVVIQDCFLEYSSSCYIVSIEVFFLNKII